MKWWKRFVCLFKSIILKSSVIRVLNVQQDKVEGGGIRQFLSRKGDQNSLGKRNKSRVLWNITWLLNCGIHLHWKLGWVSTHYNFEIASMYSGSLLNSWFDNQMF